MEIVYLNANGFCGNKDKKKSSDVNNQKNAEKILQEIFESYSYSPDILFFSEFNPNSEVGEFVSDSLEQKSYYRVDPNAGKGISEKISSMVLAFSKTKTHSEPSPNDWLKWNEILIDGYRIVGVHIPDTEHGTDMEKENAKDFWNCLEEHYQKNISNKVIIIRRKI